MSAPGDTWWGVLLDGLAGGIIGGAATGAAVWFTLRRDAARPQIDALLDKMAELARESSGMAQSWPIDDPGDEDRVRAWVGGWPPISWSLHECEARLAKRYPRARAELQTRRARIEEKTGALGPGKTKTPHSLDHQSALLVGDLVLLWQFCLDFVSEPAAYEVPLRARIMRLLRRQRSGPGAA